MYTKLFAGLLAFTCLISCDKNPGQTFFDPLFEVQLNNEFNELQGRYAAFITNKGSGEVLAFRWVPGEDTILLQVPGSTNTDRFDCTVFKISTLIAPGTGVRDTFVQVTTYTDISSGKQINLRNQVFQQASILSFNLMGMNTLDSIVVPDANVYFKPDASNGFYGEYNCYHTGRCWMRIRVNGEPFWRFVRFDNVTGDLLEANALDANLFLPIFAPVLKMDFPFFAEWEYNIDGVVDTSKLEFFPLSPPRLVPGGATPAILSANVFEPVNNDQFQPNRPYNSFRVQAKGAEDVPGGYTYICDDIYTTVPTTLPVPDFDLLPTILSDKRLIAVQCVGEFDLLAFSRVRSGTYEHFNINWEVLTKPINGIVSYRLPDVPTALGALYPHLANYAFNAGVRARAESYRKPLSYEEIVNLHIGANDPIWQAKAGYLGKEENY